MIRSFQWTCYQGKGSSRATPEGKHYPRSKSTGWRPPSRGSRTQVDIRPRHWRQIRSNDGQGKWSARPTQRRRNTQGCTALETRKRKGSNNQAGKASRPPYPRGSTYPQSMTRNPTRIQRSTARQVYKAWVRNLRQGRSSLQDTVWRPRYFQGNNTRRCNWKT
jgi:hypothetical protein